MSCLFVTNRPNYCHERFAESVGCKFYYMKRFIPERIPVLSLPVNGILNSFFLQDADVFFAESLMDFYPVYYKRPEGLKIILIAEDTLFKMENMPSIKRDYILGVLESADGFFAISEMCRKMLLKYVDKPARTVYPFPHKEFFHVNADTGSKNILFIGRNDRTKGFMELVEAVKLLRQGDREWKLYLIGECSKAVKAEQGIIPLGFVPRMEPYLRRCAFLVHPAYFDPCPATVFETMNAGMIPIISRHVGQAEIFEKSNLRRLLLDGISPGKIAEKILDVSSMNKRQISRRARRLSTKFRENGRLMAFKSEFRRLLNDLR